MDNFLEMLRDVVVTEITEMQMMKVGLKSQNGTSSHDIQNPTMCLVSHSVNGSGNRKISSDFIPPATVIKTDGICGDILTSTNPNGVDATKTSTEQNGNDIDSGIDTSDSCDEKKNKKQAQVKAVRRQHSRSLTTSVSMRLGDTFNSI